MGDEARRLIGACFDIARGASTLHPRDGDQSLH